MTEINQDYARRTRTVMPAIFATEPDPAIVIDLPRKPSTCYADDMTPRVDNIIRTIAEKTAEEGITVHGVKAYIPESDAIALRMVINFEDSHGVEGRMATIVGKALKAYKADTGMEPYSLIYDNVDGRRLHVVINDEVIEKPKTIGSATHNAIKDMMKAIIKANIPESMSDEDFYGRYDVVLQLNRDTDNMSIESFRSLIRLIVATINNSAIRLAGTNFRYPVHPGDYTGRLEATIKLRVEDATADEKGMMVQTMTLLDLLATDITKMCKVKYLGEPRLLDGRAIPTILVDVINCPLKG